MRKKKNSREISAEKWTYRRLVDFFLWLLRQESIVNGSVSDDLHPLNLVQYYTPIIGVFFLPSNKFVSYFCLEIILRTSSFFFIRSKRSFTVNICSSSSSSSKSINRSGISTLLGLNIYKRLIIGMVEMTMKRITSGSCFRRVVDDLRILCKAKEDRDRWLFERKFLRLMEVVFDPI